MAARKFRRKTRRARLEEDVREMVGMDGAQGDSSRGLAATSTKGMDNLYRLFYFYYLRANEDQFSPVKIDIIYNSMRATDKMTVKVVFYYHILLP